MTNTFKLAREKAGLSVNQCAKLLRMKDQNSIRRWEFDPDKTAHRNAPDWAFAILGWYSRKVPPSLE